MMTRPGTSSALSAVMVCALAIVPGLAWPQEKPKPFSNVVINESVIGELPQGRYAFRVTVTSVAPRAEIPFHVHCCPGVRYMLEGALTIHWAGRGTQTYSAGSTYYESAGPNHPTAGMAAANTLDLPSKLLIIELVRVD